MLIIIWIGVLFVLLVRYFQKVYSRFSKYGVRNLPTIPLIGNVGALLLKKHHIAEDMKMSYDAFPNDRFVGRFDLTSPLLVIRDLDLIKKIVLKDFESFLDHRSIVDETVDTLFGRTLFSLKGQEWKDMRSTLSPAFTSSKIRNMVPFMAEVNKQMINMLLKKIDQTGTGYIELECKDLTTRYANDVIASCAFGLKLDSHADETNEFYKTGLDVGNFNIRRAMIFFGYSTCPSLMKALNQKLYKDDIRDFFKSIVLKNMNERETFSIHRPDMIHLLMEAKKGTLTMSTDEKSRDADAGFATVQESNIGKKSVTRSWTDDDLISQAFLFFLAGFETVSSVMSFLLHELAVNPDIQERVAKEIQEDSKKTGGKFDYNNIHNMTYMDMVISEVLRLWPPVVGLDRLCNMDYNLGRPNEKATQDYIIRKGEHITIPTWAIHHDPQYFPNPEKFDPERFSEQNKHNIKPFTYIPFGAGPRNCIGSRFALCEVKVMLYQLLQHLEVSPCAKTTIPAKLSTAALTIQIEGGHWVRLTPRK